jgi:hypothetical protein
MPVVHSLHYVALDAADVVFDPNGAFSTLERSNHD